MSGGHRGLAGGAFYVAHVRYNTADGVAVAVCHREEMRQGKHLPGVGEGFDLSADPRQCTRRAPKAQGGLCTLSCPVVVSRSLCLSIFSLCLSLSFSLRQALAFLDCVGKHAPLVVAAALDAGSLPAWSECLAALPATQRLGAHKLIIELTCNLCAHKLPELLIECRTPRRLASLLIGRAVDEAADLPSRTHATMELMNLVDAVQPWAEHALPHGIACSDDETDAAVVSSDADDDTYDACVRGLLGALPAAVATSKPLASRLLNALSVVLRQNPRRVPFNLSVTCTTGRGGAWLRAVREAFDAILMAVEAVGDISHPMISLLNSTPLDSYCLGILFRRITTVEPTHAELAGTDVKEPVLMHLLRSQLIYSGDHDVGSNADAADGADGATRRNERSIAWQLVQLMASVEHARFPEYGDILLRALVRPPRMLQPPLLRALLSCADAEGGEGGEGALSLIARAARMEPAAVSDMLPLDDIETRLRSFLGSADTAHVATDARVAALVAVAAASLRHAGGSQQHLDFFTSVAPALALCGAEEPLVDVLCAHPVTLAQKALARLLETLRRRCDGGHAQAAVALMRTVGAAAPNVVRIIRVALLKERHAVVAAASAAAEAAAATTQTGVEDASVSCYDYMATVTDSAAEEEAISLALLSRLQTDPVHACLPCVLECARQARCPLRTRVAAVSAAARLMHSHERIAESALPYLAALVAPAHPSAVRSAAVLGLAALAATYPAHCETPASLALHTSLKPSSTPSLRQTALHALSDLVLARRLQPANELVHVLPMIADGNSTIAANARATAHSLATVEGPVRWARLLHSALLQLSAIMTPEPFGRLTATLVPGTIEQAPVRDLESLGDALTTHLTSSSSLRVAASSPSDVHLRHNLARLIGAWPPSDKAVGTLARALGCSTFNDGHCSSRSGDIDGGGDRGSRTALWSTAFIEVGVRCGLRAMVHHARNKCAGRVLDAVAAALAACPHGSAEDAPPPHDEVEVEQPGRIDTDSSTNHGLAADDGDAEMSSGIQATSGASRRKRHNGDVCSGSGAEDAASMLTTAAELAGTAIAARGAIESLRSDRSLYASVRLPDLQSRETAPKRARST